MIVITGAAGFIGSCLAARYNALGHRNLALVDDFEIIPKKPNWQHKQFEHLVQRSDFASWIDEHAGLVKAVYHLGARTDTTEFDYMIFKELNLDYSKMVWNKCVQYRLPLVYASSAATYGDGSQGYIDDHDIVPELTPLNPYGLSKNEFDLWAIMQPISPPKWVGVKFFNVYGPNESHKGRMASVVFHAFNQIKNTGKVKLFRSHRPDFEDGHQQRDFIYVKDVVSMCKHLMDNKKALNGLYNIGTGKARTFLDLVHAVFAALGKEPVVEFIDTPEDIRDKYQYFTEARMWKFENTGYPRPMHTLEEGITDYVIEHLSTDNTY